MVVDLSVGDDAFGWKLAKFALHDVRIEFALRTALRICLVHLKYVGVI